MRDLPALVKKPFSSRLPSKEEIEEEKQRGKELFSQIDLSSTALIFYGVGLGSVFQKLYPLMDEAYFFIIEKEIEEIEKFSSQNIASSFFSHPRSFLFHLESHLQLEEVLRSICWKMGFSSFQLITTKKNSTDPIFLQIEKLLPSIQMGVEMAISDYADLGEEIYKNCYINYLREGSCSSISQWEDLCRGIPAIICGAGESLQQELSKIDPSKALVFAGGQSLPMLFSAGITPHLAASMDPRAPVEKVKGIFPDLPFLFHGRTNPSHFSYIENELYYLAGNKHHPLEGWLWDKEPLIDIGWTVTNTLLAVALYMGCDPIILVGQDLAFTSEGYYGKDELELENDHWIEELDYYGNTIFTKKDFLMARDWIAEKGKEFPNRIFVSQKRGLNKGKEIGLYPLEKLKNENRRDWKAVLQTSKEVQIATKEQKISRLIELKESLIRCQEKCETMLESSLQTIEPIDHELADILILRPFWNIWHWVFEREVEKEKEFSSWKMALHQLLFFQDLAKRHNKLIEEVLSNAILHQR